MLILRGVNLRKSLIFSGKVGRIGKIGKEKTGKIGGKRAGIRVKRAKRGDFFNIF